MADFTASTCVKNSGGAFNLLAAQASQTVDMSDRDDERVIIVADNTGNLAAMTATITIAPGGFLASVLGTASIDVAGAARKVLGPFEGSRFKSTASKLTVAVSVTQSGTVSSVLLGVVKLP